MALAEDFARFADELREGSNGLMSELTFFPSGAMSMRVRFSINRLFDLDYFPSQEIFGVDELAADAEFNTGYRYTFQDFESAKDKMVDLLEEARSTLAPAQ